MRIVLDEFSAMVDGKWVKQRGASKRRVNVGRFAEVRDEKRVVGNMWELSQRASVIVLYRNRVNLWVKLYTPRVIGSG